MWRPGKSSIPLVAETNQQLDRAPPDRQTGSKKRAAGGDASPVGLRPPFDPSPPELSHPDCRWLLTLIVAAHRSDPCGIWGSSGSCRNGRSRPRRCSAVAAPQVLAERFRAASKDVGDG